MKAEHNQPEYPPQSVHNHLMKLTVNILIGAMTLGGIGCNNVKEFAIYDPVKKKLIYSDKPIRCNHIKLTLEDMEELGINFRNPTPEQLKNYENKCNALEKKIQESMSDPNTYESFGKKIKDDMTNNSQSR